MHKQAPQTLFAVDPDQLAEQIGDNISEVVSNAITAAMQENCQPLLVDCERMARLASVSPSTIDRLRKANTIPSVMLGSSRRYEPAKVVAALVSNNDEAAQ